MLTQVSDAYAPLVTGNAALQIHNVTKSTNVSKMNHVSMEAFVKTSNQPFQNLTFHLSDIAASVFAVILESIARSRLLNQVGLRGELGIPVLAPAASG